MSVKHDKPYARTAQDIERKTSARKTYAEVLSFFNDLRSLPLDSALTHEIKEQSDIFKKNIEKIAKLAMDDLEENLGLLHNSVTDLSKKVDGKLDNSILTSGVWSPVLSEDTVLSYSLQSGWYLKLGAVVTVGFNISAECVPGTESVAVEIGGLPFFPLLPSAGGGICSGVQISGGYDFQCYVAETNGIITTRVQPCNNVEVTILETSSDGCFYRSDGGDITLSGTITYVTSSIMGGEESGVA